MREIKGFVASTSPSSFKFSAIAGGETYLETGIPLLSAVDPEFAVLKA